MVILPGSWPSTLPPMPSACSSESGQPAPPTPAAASSQRAQIWPAAIRHAPGALPRRCLTLACSRSNPTRLGRIAQRLAATDKPGAMELLEAAFRDLDQLAATGQSSTLYGNAQIAAAILPIVEEIMPDRLAEFLPRALSLRDPWLESVNAVYQAQEIVQLAIMIARYDRDLAARLLQPQVEHLGTFRALATYDAITFRVLAALAMIDPRQAVEQVEQLPDDSTPGIDESSPKSALRIYVARLLAAHGKKRWTYIYEYFLYLWTPDQRYL